MQFGLSQNIIESINKIFEQNSKVDEVMLFGSRAKGNYRDDSDIDLAVKGRNISYKDILSIGAKLESLNLPYKIDLINYATINDKEVVEHIDRVGIEFYSRWKEFKLGNAPLEIIDGDRGKNYPSQQEFTSIGDCLFLSTKNVRINGFDFSDCQFISNERDSILRKGKLQRNDLVLTTRGTIGNIGFYSDGIKYNCIRINSGMVIIRPNTKELLPVYNYYVFRHLQKDFLTFTSGSAQPQLPIKDLNHIDIKLPPLSEQTNIASILSSLDDKIDLLHRQNKTLEQLAETLFRQWFVEEADESWEMVKVSDFAYINKLTVSRNYPFTVIEYLDTGSITEGVIENFETYNLSDAPSRAQRIVKDNDIVYSLVRPIQRHYGLLNNVKENTVVSTGFCVITSKRISPYFLYLLLTRNDAVDYFDMIAEGSTSAYPSLKPSDIANFEFKKPPEEKLNKFNKVSSDILNKIKSNTNQIKSLTQLRDTLLPKLMSGEVRVNN